MNGIEDVADIHPGYFVSFLGKEKSPVTISSYLSALSQFAEFAYEEGILENGDYLLFRKRLKRLRGRPVERKLPSVPSEAAFQAILIEARKPFSGTVRQNLGHLRDLALVETLRSTGCRVAEICALRRRHLQGNQAVVTGKGRKSRIVFFDPAAQNALEVYLALRGPGEDDDPVFARHDRLATGVMPLSTTSVRFSIDRLAVAAGLEASEMSPHKFRHRFATRILTSTGDLAGVQDLLGHSSPVTTRIYARLTRGHLESIHGSVAL